MISEAPQMLWDTGPRSGHLCQLDISLMNDCPPRAQTHGSHPAIVAVTTRACGPAPCSMSSLPGERDFSSQQQSTGRNAPFPTPLSCHWFWEWILAIEFYISHWACSLCPSPLPFFLPGVCSNLVGAVGVIQSRGGMPG